MTERSERSLAQMRWAFENYERYGYASLDVLSKPEREKVLARPVAGIERMVEDGHFPLSYVIITRSQKAAVFMPSSSTLNIQVVGPFGLGART